MPKSPDPSAEGRRVSVSSLEYADDRSSAKRDWPGWQRDQELVTMYAAEVREAVAGSIDVDKLRRRGRRCTRRTSGRGAPGAALSGVAGVRRPTARAGGPTTPHVPGARPGYQGDPRGAEAAFLGRAARHQRRPQARSELRLTTEAWLLGNRSALAAVDSSLTSTGAGGRRRLRGGRAGRRAGAEAAAGRAAHRIKSIADSRLEELSQVLEETLRSDEIRREPTGPLPPFLSVATSPHG